MINGGNHMTEDRDLKKHFEVILGREIHEDTGDRNDALFTVMAWDQTGTPAGTVVFDWRCLSEISSVIL
jgi:hypothetical protein